MTEQLRPDQPVSRYSIISSAHLSMTGYVKVSYVLLNNKGATLSSRVFLLS